MASIRTDGLFNQSAVNSMTEKPQTRGGARKGTGPKPGTTDGGALMPKTVKLDETSVQILTAYGNGKLSEGIRKAARRVAELDSNGVPA